MLQELSPVLVPSPLDPHHAPATAPQRLVSLDVLRGAVMLCLLSGGLGFQQLAEAFPDNRLLPVLALHTEHVAWSGAVFWDFIQPCFMFAVGVAIAYSSNKRRATQPYAWLLGHQAGRALLLIALGIFLRSNGREQTNFVFTDVLTQIGLGSLFVFLLWRQSPVTQGVVAFSVLVSYWCFFYFYPLDPAFDYSQFGLTNYQPLEGIAGHWNIHNNAAAKFDRWFLNLLPQVAGQPYVFSPGGYQTLNFVPAAVTMLFGLMAGEWLLEDRSTQQSVLGLFILGALGIAVGYLLHTSGLCPLVKRLWTPSWTLYSAGWAAITLAFLYVLFDVANLKPVAGPIIALGRNSLLLYVLFLLCRPWLLQSVNTHFNAPLFQWLAVHHWLPLQVRESWKTDPPADLFHLFGVYQPTAEHAFVLVVFAALAYWMYRKRIFVNM
jgi:predicted acyltransferase